MHKLPFPIETPEAELFWASKHRCNRAKAIIAFSRTPEEAIQLMRRLEGWNIHLRKKALKKYRIYVGYYSMTDIPFSPTSNVYWQDEMAGAPDQWPFAVSVDAMEKLYGE